MKLSSCGIDCAACKFSVELGQSCPGCHAVTGKPFWSNDGACDLYTCASEKKLHNCGKCGDFPCGMLTEWASGTDDTTGLPENGQRIENLKQVAAENTIEAHVLETLTGDVQSLALDFIAFLRMQDMQFERSTTDYWADKRYWYIKFHNEFVGFILINGYGCVGDETEPEGWIFWSDNYISEFFAMFSLDTHTKEIAWQHVDFGTCGGRISVELFGKKFHPVCNGNHFPLQQYRCCGTGLSEKTC
jgi:hypothetical protein